MIKKQKKIFALICLTVFQFSCSRDDEAPIETISIDLPSNYELTYGDDLTIDLSEIKEQANSVEFELDFSQTANVKIDNSKNLHDQLKQAMVVSNAGQARINFKSALVYPTGAVSSINDQQIPEEYKVTILASDSNDNPIGEKTISIKVLPGSIQVEGAEISDGISFSYALYSNDETKFNLNAPAIDTDNLTWSLPEIKDYTESITLSDNQIVFSGVEGNPSQQEELKYNLTPSLLKNGFPVCNIQFQVIFIPEIKFFYGFYLPEGDMSILINLLHLSKAGGSKTSAPVLYPSEYSGSYEIVKIEKDEQPYEDLDGIFNIIKETGEVTTKENNTLAAGDYRITIKAITSTGLEFNTFLTLSLE
ncbi:hypothetical protein DSM03_11159 [Leeuwenhoekiella aestuarii]|uniref:hypothetical protein n=1 Tax=Leeuwenhoekiella aestuarii TaxID=2249426 RepID=UPI000FFEB99B|nr:hypothetical protein [Leeuwenhoekiella aestuarii]RXG12185.1 hypothetical protein DSM03_11159 [Leeuwenhoekiella aestuarii]